MKQKAPTELIPVLLSALKAITAEFKEDLRERGLLDDLPEGSWKAAIKGAEAAIIKATNSQK